MKVLITSGGTKVMIDKVRHIGNMSQGTFGSKIAYEFMRQPQNPYITFLHAKGSKHPNDVAISEHDFVKQDFKINDPTFDTFDDYQERLAEELDRQPDIVVLAAAVSDYGVENYVDGKIRSSDSLTIQLKPLPKLISTVRKKCPNSVICGFKLLVNSTERELYLATTKSLYGNRCDLVIGNDLRDIKNNDHKLFIARWLKPMVWDEEKTKRAMFMYSYGISYEEYTQPKYNLAEVVVSQCTDIYRQKNNKKD